MVLLDRALSAWVAHQLVLPLFTRQQTLLNFFIEKLFQLVHLDLKAFPVLSDNYRKHIIQKLSETVSVSLII